MFVGQETEDRTCENKANICCFSNFYFRNGFRPRGNREKTNTIKPPTPVETAGLDQSGGCQSMLANYSLSIGTP
jgi:hypothetical protein